VKRGVIVLLAFCAGSLARADIGPPAGKKSVPVTTIVEATEDFSDYAFFEVAFSSSPGPPPHGGTSISTTIHFFVPGTVIKATGDRRSGGSLYAVPRTAVEGFPSWKDYVATANSNPSKSTRISTSESWSDFARSVKRGEVPGATSLRFGGSEDLPTTDERTAITENYRIVRTPAGVAFVRPDEPADAAEAAVGNPEPASREVFPWRWVVAGGAAFAAILLGGLWIALRSRKV
jgi:hypothetical protein